MQTDTLYYGDCLELMREWDSHCVDLIYLDPPFNSDVNYNILFGAKKAEPKKTDLAQLTAFTDTWQWNEDAHERVARIESAVKHPAHLCISAFHKMHPDGSGMLSYLSYMAERLAEMQRILKPTGSIYLHCDQTASHYLKLLMDEIFGGGNFLNDIIWSYRRWAGKASRYQRMHDSLLFYKNGEQNIWTKPMEPKAAGTPKYRRWNEWDEEKQKLVTRSDKSKAVTETNMRDVWPIARLQSSSKERLGYPTQKPLALLERIIKASSNEGDVVLDPFCGCGTTIEAAINLNRKWVGVDISTYALEVIRRERLNDMKFEVIGIPKDLPGARLFARDKPFDFEKWAVTRIRGFAPNTVQTGDGGIDGRAMIHNRDLDNRLCIAQVKGGKPNISDLRAFCGSLAGGKAAIGIFITLEKWHTPSVQKCIADAGKLTIGASEFNRLVMYSIAEHFDEVRPNLPPFAHPRTGAAMQDELLDLQDKKR